MPVQNFEWVKITLNSGRKFFMRDFQFDGKVYNAIGQYGTRMFNKEKDMYFEIFNETKEKIELKMIDNFGFNPNFIETIDVIRDKEVEVVK